MTFYSAVNRRDFLKTTLYAGTALALSGAGLQRAWAAAKGTVNFADIGVGDPGGDWTRFTKQADWDVNLVAIGNAPSAMRADTLTPQGTRLRYVNCPVTPFLDSSEQSACEGL